MTKRLFDIVSASVAILFLLPFFPIIALAIKFDSRGPVIYRQIRIGRDGVPFKIFKLRSMTDGADKLSPITSAADRRITRVGGFLRRCKIDELTTLLNVVKGEMSIVGPRPEIPVYVAQYSDEQRRVLSVRPGITDFGTVELDNEAQLMPDGEDVEKIYVEQILPKKLGLNLKYIDKQSFLLDLRIIMMTFLVIVRRFVRVRRQNSSNRSDS